MLPGHHDADDDSPIQHPQPSVIELLNLTVGRTWTTFLPSVKDAEKGVFAVSLDEAVRQISEEKGGADAAKELLHADVAEIEAAASRQSVEPDYLIESALETAQHHLSSSRDLVARVEEYWLHCNKVAGAIPYELIVRAAEFLATALQNPPLADEKLWELAESSYWQNRLVAGWVVRDRGDEVAKDIAKILAADTFTDDNGFFLVREAVGEYE